MSKNPASTTATGGGGYSFADKVAAGFLAAMLKREFPFGEALGTIAAVDFETRESGFLLDDLLLLLRRGNDASRCLVSVKSNRQLTKAGFNREFVTDTWDQWDGGDHSDFKQDEDRLCLVVGIADEATLTEWRELQKQASSTTPERLAARMETDGQFSAIQRSLFASLRKAKDSSLRDGKETAQLISRLHVVRFSDESESDLINTCADLVLAGTIEEGAKLWSRLLQLASENRATGGHFDIKKLIRVLSADFELRDYPDFRNDWHRIEQVSAENIKSIRNVVGTGVHLAREDEKARLTAAIASERLVVIAGESGSGKSAIVSHILASGAFKRIVWLTAGQLSKPSQAELSEAFGMRHGLPELIVNSAMEGSVLVIDAFEKFEGEALRRATELMQAVKDESFLRWKIIITCQPPWLESTRDAVVEAGIAHYHAIDFDKPNSQEVFNAVAAIPGLMALVARQELQPILCNLMVLDWVLRADVARSLSASKAWIGETEIIDAIWERWIGTSTAKLARDSLLRSLGRREGEKLSGAVHVDTIPSNELLLLGELDREGLIRVKDEFIQFAHDLMGDWARYRHLKFERGHAPQIIRALAHVPRWGRAIRVYAQALVERRDGLDQWKAANDALSGDDPDSKIAADFFLDGLIFAANSESLIDQVWPDLIASKGHILDRLLKRLVHVASVPDWRVIGLDDPESVEQSQAWFRIPQPLYWYPVLRVLSRHAADVAKHALLAGAEVCALWLRTMPPLMPGRTEAGQLALELAREAQGLRAEGLHFRDEDKVIYEAALSAAPEYPDECTEVALELCGRRDEPAHAVQRRRDEQERQAKERAEWLKNNPAKRKRRQPVPIPVGSYSEGPLRRPFPDGPLRAVPRGFRAAIMDTPALNGLIAVRPEIATEVLLATCIEEPKPWEAYRERFTLDRLSLADWRKGYPAMYWKGPFLRFLQGAPQQGLDAILRLVNYATLRWIENGLGREPEPDDWIRYGLTFEIGGAPRPWLGNAQVYAWHRFLPMHAGAVECALMALERWFYEELEKRQDITSWMQIILEQSQSVAFAGVLVTVGLRFPVLFTKVIRPLLGNIHVYEAQADLAAQEWYEGWSGSMTNEPQQALRLAAEWHRMPHRRALLRDVAPQLMFYDEGTKDYLLSRKAEWEKLPVENDEERVQREFFLARFDPANYTETQLADGRIMPMLQWPHHLQVIAEQSRKKTDLGGLTLNLALRARKLLNDQEALGPEDVPKFATQVRSVAESAGADPDGSMELYRANSVAGGLAVLVIKHRTWLAQEPEIEAWCFATMRSLKPVLKNDNSPWIKNDHNAEAFLGEAGVALLQETAEEWVLQLAFNGITGSEYSSTFFTLWRAYLLRGSLGDKFDELINVMAWWSALRHAAGRESGYFTDDANRLDKFRPTLFRRLTSGKLRGPLAPLLRVETLGRRLIARIDERSMSKQERDARKAHQEWRQHNRQDDHELDREMPDLDLGVLQRGLGFIQAMVREQGPTSEPRLRRYIEELFQLEMRSLPQPIPGDDRSEVRGTPYESDRWIMARVAEYIARTNSIESGRVFYQPILALGPAAKHWVQDFLQSWIVDALDVSPDLDGFAAIWKDMIVYTDTLPAWQPRDPQYWNPAEVLAVDLVGLGEVVSAVLGDPGQTGLVRRMAPMFAGWGDRWLKHAYVAAWFANFLRTDSGSVLMTQGVKQLAAAAPALANRDWHERDLGSLFTDILRKCWRESHQEIEADPELRRAFLSLLAQLCARQIPEALHLRTKVAEVLGAA